MISHEQEIRSGAQPPRSWFGLPPGRWILFGVFAAGLVLAPFASALLWFDPSTLFRAVVEASPRDWLSIALAQAPSLAIALLLHYGCLRCQSIPAWVPIVLFSPVCLAHCFSTIWMTFAGQPFH